MQFTVERVEESNLRIDRFLAEKLPDLSRSRLQSLIKDGHITLNGNSTKSKQPICEGDIIKITIPPLTQPKAKPENIKLNILYEDEHLVVINKPHGLVVHPAAGNPDGTLVNALLHHCNHLSGIGGVERPGIVHRLDKDTSGCLVAAKSDTAHRHLVESFTNRQVKKLYLAVVNGCPSIESGKIENHIARNPKDRQKMTVVTPPRGKLAITNYSVKKKSDGASLIECHLLTGRTHQIRVHMKSLGNPILGDPIYSRAAKQNTQVTRLMLHAWKLSFIHPETRKEMHFHSEHPAEFNHWMD
jgi:23S rRNA pseudouridine1911/1915/1917 synthase